MSVNVDDVNRDVAVRVVGGQYARRRSCTRAGLRVRQALSPLGAIGIARYHTMRLLGARSPLSCARGWHSKTAERMRLQLRSIDSSR